MQSIHSAIYDAAYGEPNDGYGALLAITYRGKGVALRGYHALNWSNEIRTAMDQTEADQICRAIYNEV